MNLTKKTNPLSYQRVPFEKLSMKNKSKLESAASTALFPSQKKAPVKAPKKKVDTRKPAKAPKGYQPYFTP